MLPGLFFPPTIYFYFNLFLFCIEFALLSTTLWLNFDLNNRISSTFVSSVREEGIYHIDVYDFHSWDQ